MEGRKSGDTFEVTVEPEEIYGVSNDANVQRIPLKRLKGLGIIMPGQIMNLQTKQAPVQVTALKVARFNVGVDANHPLAGRKLTFDLEITDVRDASAEETEHGHAHGPVGHNHESPGTSDPGFCQLSTATRFS
jgi:FKBP-type peptidyl-prolyl cis-trans isomerase SlyD